MMGSAVLTPAAERRAFEVRLASVSAGRLEGLAAPFGVTITHGGTRERIEPGAFARSLVDGTDILALADHDLRKVIGRMRTGRLELAETGEGLTFGLDVADTAAGRDVLALAERGDLGGVSIGFWRKGTVEEQTRDEHGAVRVYRSINLRAVSIISAWPAYPTTANKRDTELSDETASLARARRARRLRLAELGA